MSNLVKSFYISSGQEKRVIDYNELISKKIDEAKSYGAEEDIAGIGSGDGFVAGFEADVIEVVDDPELLADAPVNEQPVEPEVNPEELILKAQKEAEIILEDAKREADALWNTAYASAKKEGYEDGKREGAVELERMRSELQKERVKQQKEYVDMLNTMEADLVSVMLEVFGKVTKVLSEDKKDIILHLIDATLGHIDNSKQFIIRVSKSDYQHVEDNKEQFLSLIPGSGSLEVVKDATLKKNQCLIETDGGVFDCGLDTQLENLMDSIKALSCV